MKKFLQVTTVFVSVFLFGRIHYAAAATPWTYTSLGGTVGADTSGNLTYIDSAGATSTIPNMVYFGAGFASSTVFNAPFTYITSVSVLLGARQTPIQDNVIMGLVCSDKNGERGWTNSEPMASSTITTGFLTPTTFTWATPAPCDSASLNFMELSLGGNGAYGNNHNLEWGYYYDTSGALPYYGLVSGGAGNFPTDFDADYKPTLSLNSAYPENATLSFESPPFSPGFTSPDFFNWWLNLDIPSNHDPGMTGYYFDVTYGTSSPTGVATDSLLSTIGILPLGSSEGVSTSPLLQKSASSTPGTYEAQATLYDQTGDEEAQSAVLHYTISGDGSIRVTVPNNNTTAGTGAGSCSATNFVLLDVDFGKGICDVANFLFVPSQSQLNSVTNLETDMQNRMPMSYIYEIQSDFASISPTAASMTPLTLTIGATGTPINFSFDAFSESTIDKYTTPTVRALLKTVMEYALYLAYISMIILEVRKLFSKPKQ